jgi:hypothetical protein
MKEPCKNKEILTMAGEKPVVPTKTWHGDNPLELQFPKSWDDISCEMNGHHLN